MVSPLKWAFGSLASRMYGPEHADPNVTAVIEPATYTEHVVSRLHHFDSQVVPPSARVDPFLLQRVSPPFRFSNLFGLGVLVVKKSTELAGELFAHHVWGPRKKSWGIEMTVITTMMRGMAQYSHITNLGMLRAILNILGYAPIPSDAMVTPVTFRVRRRKLRGFLAECSMAEDGTRELAGEWVVGRTLWKKLQAEWRASRSFDNKGPGTDTAMERKDRVILYIHGGAFYMFSASTHRTITIQLSKHLGARLFAIDYRLAPETRFPGQILDVMSSYMRLIEDLHIPAENIIIAGDSAGGALTLALLMYLRDNKYPLPSGAIVMSPWADLTMSCDSWDSNEPFDIIPIPVPGDHLHPILCYLGQEGMEKYLTHPYVSPLFGDFSGMPPLLIQCGDSEVLRDEITLLAHKASRSGVKVRHELYEDCVHVFQTFPFLEASRRAFLSCRDFVHRVLPAEQNRSPQLLDNVAQAGLEAEIDNEKTRPVATDGREEDMDQATDVETNCQELDIPDINVDGISVSSSTPSTLNNFEEGLELPDQPIALPTSSRRYLPRLSITTQQLPRGRHLPTAPNSPVTLRPRNSRNHLREGTSVGGIPRSALTMSSCISSAPKPIIRSRGRAVSHPDICSLCEDWAETGPANKTTLYTSHPLPVGN